ncbi:MAG TPA: zinc ribbon domain-containing protein [Armatimonadota bacterium]|nr:zinc ribbon domain-containing protein [Armatimonadota bacterium]
MPEVVPLELVNQAAALLEHRQYSPRRPQTLLAYGGLLSCSLCGSLLVPVRGNSDGVRFLQWVCKMKRLYGACDSHHVSDRYVDAMAARAAQNFFSQTKAQVAQGILPPAPMRPPRARDLSAMRDRAVHLYVQGHITEAEFLNLIAELDAKADPVPPPSPRISMKQVLAIADRVEENWQASPIEEKRGLLVQIGAEITINTTGVRPLWMVLETPLLAEPIKISCHPRNRWGIDWL